MKIYLLTIFCLLPLVLTGTAQCPCQENQTFDISSWSCRNYPKTGDREYINNCKFYQIKYEDFQCSQCEDSYKLVSNYQTGKQQCVKTDLEGCNNIYGGPQLQEESQFSFKLSSLLSFGNGYQCYGCDSENYYQVNTKCEKNPDQNSQYYVQNCAEYEFRNNQPVCNKCQDGYYVSSDQTLCHQNPYEENCVKFQYSYSARTGVCSQCIDGYSVTQNYRCVKSDIIIDNCQVAHYGSYYYCTQCNIGYYLSEDRKSCLQNPTQGQEGYVANCRDYKLGQKLYCDWCQNDYSLDIANGSICVKVKSFNQVDHCTGYKTGGNYQDQCRGCESGYEPTTLNIRGCRQCPSS